MPFVRQYHCKISFLLLINHKATCAQLWMNMVPNVFSVLLLQILASASDSYRELSSASVVVQPVIFLKLMTCVTMMVDLAMNLANNIDSYLEISWPIVMSTHGSLEAAPSAHRVRTTETLSLLYKNRPLRCEVRLPCRGLLHLFGPWLFRASLLARPEGISCRR